MADKPIVSDTVELSDDRLRVMLEDAIAEERVDTASALTELLSHRASPTYGVTEEMVEAFEREFYADKGGGPDGRSTRQSIRDALRIVLRAPTVEADKQKVRVGE